MGRKPKKRVLTKAERFTMLDELAETMLTNGSEIVPHSDIEKLFDEKKNSTGWRNVVLGLKRRIEKEEGELVSEHGVGYFASTGDEEDDEEQDMSFQTSGLSQDGEEVDEDDETEESVEIDPSESYNVIMRDNLVVLVNQQDRNQKIVIEGGNIF